MLGSPGSPFRSGSGHRAPWPPPTHHTTEGFTRYGVSGGLYSLFPGATDSSAAIYSQATSATARFAHGANTYPNFIGAHKVADSLFSSAFTFGGPTPPPQPPPSTGSPFSPVPPLVERNISQIELIAKGFTNNNDSNINNNINNGGADQATIIPPTNNIINNSNNNKKVENKRRSECALYQENVDRRQASASVNKRRWERDTQTPIAPPVVKNEVSSRSSCACRRPNVTTSSASFLSARNNANNNNGAIVTSDNNAASFPLPPQCERKHEQLSSETSGCERKKLDTLLVLSGGCSRTNPVSLRNGGGSACSVVANGGHAGGDWLNNGVVIKKEPLSSGTTTTPCQVAEVTTSLRLPVAGVVSNPPASFATVIKVETVGTTSSCSVVKKEAVISQHAAISNAGGSIPVGIAVARQRLQDCASSSKALLLAPATEPRNTQSSHQQQQQQHQHHHQHQQFSPCRQQKPLQVSVPQEVQCASLTEITTAPATALSTMTVLQSQCEDRVTNGVTPWAATTNHNPALTPPTLWQYPTPVPIQLGPSTDHMPLPPVGYQLVRDPISGHFLLIPAANIEHLQRTVLWPSYQTTLQPSLHMATQPATQHIQLFESAEPTEYLNSLTTAQTNVGQTARILVQPQLTITATTDTTTTTTTTTTSTSKRKPAVVKLEVTQDDAVKSQQMVPVVNRQVEVSNPTTPVFSTSTTVAPVTHFFYEHPAAVVQIAQTPQPSAAVQTDNGKRSQATSPVNPVEACLTPPPEKVASHSESEESNMAVPVEVHVQDASNQTDTPPVSEDERPDPPVDVSGLELLSNSIEQFESHVKPDTRPADQTAAETLQLLGQATRSEALVCDMKMCDADLAGEDKVEIVKDRITCSKEDVVDQVMDSVEDANNGSNMLGGLGLLCALAEQRIMEEVGPSPAKTENQPEVNRNYKTRKSERECRKYIASKVQQCYLNGTASGSSSPQDHSSFGGDAMDTTELNVRMHMADLQRKYREQQRELSKLTPKKTGSDGSTSGDTVISGGPPSPVKRRPGRPRKKCIQDSVPSPPTSPSRPKVGRPKVSVSSKELPPPVLEKVTDIAKPRSRFDVDDAAAPKLKASKLDILKPPTLTANRILTCAKFKPVSSNNIPDTAAAKSLKLPQCNVNLVKLATGHQANGKLGDESTNKKTELRNKRGISSVENAGSTNKLSAYPSCRLPLQHSTSHTFGSKPPSRLPSPGETENLFWFKNMERPSSFTSQGERLSPTPEITGQDKKVNAPIADTPSLFSVSSSSKKRKVGRPKKHFPATGCEVATETIVAKKPKSKSNLVGLLLSKSCQSKPSNIHHSTNHKPLTPATAFKSHSSNRNGNSYNKLLTPSHKNIPSLKTEKFSSTPSYKTISNSHKTISSSNNNNNDIEGSTKSSVTVSSFFKNSQSTNSSQAAVVSKRNTGTTIESSEHKPNKIRPKLKAEAKVKPWSWCDEEDVESIDWLNTNKVKGCDSPKPSFGQVQLKNSNKVEKVAVNGSNVSGKRKLNAPDSKPATTNKVSKKNVPTPIPKASKDKSAVASEKRTKPEEQESACKKRKLSSSSTNQGGVSSESEDIPLSVYTKQNTTTCLLTQTHLNTEKQRALTVMGGLFYAGTVSAIRAPDVYGITLDGERGNRPHIYSREEILRDAILEVRPSNISVLAPSTRVCAYWSQQYRCLYPGTVAQPSSPDSELDQQFVSVEFDDGDNGRINIDDIRLLPLDYPTVEYDPNPLLSLGKRRRRNSGTSCESHSKDRRTSAESVPNSVKVTQQPVKSTSNQNEQKQKGTTGNSVSKPSSGVGKNTATAKDASRLAPNEATRHSKPTEAKIEEDPLRKIEVSDHSSRERKRLKKHRREKLKRLLSCSGGALAPDGCQKKRRKKHRCSEEHCRHKRHHKRHRKHKHRHGNRNKDSSSGSSGESATKSGEAEMISRLSPVVEQLDILDIQQTAIRELTSSNDQSASSAVADTVVANPPAVSEPDEENQDSKKIVKKDKEGVKPKKCRDRQPSAESRSKMAAFLPARQLWGWSGRGFKRPGAKGRGKKEFFKAIQRGKETIRVGDCAVFLSTGRPDRPYIGRIESMWESWGTNMVVKVKWFYHPEETTGCTAQLKYPGALFESPHVDENDVQTISHKCEVLALDVYTEQMGAEPQRYSTIYDNNDIYYLAGYYDPTISQLTMKPGVV